MSLRTRLTAVVAAAVAFAVIGGAYAAHYSIGRELRREVDAFLLDRMDGFTRHGPFRPFDSIGGGLPPAGRGRLFDFDSVAQVIDSQGRILASLPMGTVLPVTEEEMNVGQNNSPPARFRDITISEGHFRMLTASLPGGRKVQIARSLAETDQVLAALRNRLGIIALIGTALAGLGAWALGRRATRPIEDLTAACEQVALTQDLTSPVASGGGGELGRLASSFNTMLQALATSRQQQHHLVADAGHELRTPLTAIRTNVDFLGRAESLPDAERQQVLTETSLELDELTTLIGELVQLATDARSDEPIERVDLGELVDNVAGRYRRRSARVLTVDTESAGEVEGRRTLLDRAVSNLVDNALKFSPPDSGIDIVVSGGLVEVKDRGSGIAEEDEGRIFDRFYRATSARTLPGSGLGLAIVAQIVESHGGQVSLENRLEKGAIARISLPPSPGFAR